MILNLVEESPMKVIVSTIVASLNKAASRPEAPKTVCNFDNDYYGDQKCIQQ